ncbi:hypothetical protein [Natrinema versiforme]|uniref:Uncharacterized protein n=1 Tax=Natrinema versiforme JCM 10478 TaxID=1227496 RepID=L9Y6I3_9EURY|nr:hypothetical protein [Natrinema versiforme]ELY69261.1 hypothetical protein C489_04878 [Natrinema versiforme JCM 10478]
MKTLEVTDEQYAFIQYLREEISDSVVGKYGFVRERDAVQFLIDNLDEDIEIDIDGEFDSSATDDVSASVGAAIEGDDDPHELEEVSYVEGETPAADEVLDEDADDPDSETDGADDDASSEDESADAADESADGADSDGESDADDGDGETAADDSDDGGDGDGSADDDEMLDEMMSLLETHDDKWTESDSADFRYTVELPDGSSEQVQTKDDVRALLFKNYR